jgi:broad specificity phosphatase PhoE
LTVHGFEQARRLGLHIKSAGVDLTHIFCSPLQRALITAEQVRDGQTAEARKDTAFVPVAALCEQDFGLFEGIAIREYCPGDGRYSSVETAEAMARRADGFINEHLAPLFGGDADCTVAVVSHGCLLRVLWPQLLSKVVPRTLDCAQETLTGGKMTKHIAWSNTAFLEARFVRNLHPTHHPSNIVAQPGVSGLPATPSDVKDAEVGYDAAILTINGRPHLEGFRKAPGGVANARYDGRQTSLAQYFGQG